MRFLLKSFNFFLFTFSFLLITHHSSLITRDAVAQSEFETDYKVTYTVDQNGRTNVSQDIVLKNKTANYYAEKFELKIGSTKVEDVKASDLQGPMETNASFENNVTTISVKFNERVIGIDKTLPWTLNYSSSELAARSGQIWEISIPRLANSPDIGQYLVKVAVPKIFGPIAFAVPQPQQTNTTAFSQEFTFDKDQLIKSGIAMSFGQKQVFSFILDYYLQNNNLTSQYQQIALPPDNNYQKIAFEKIEPTPENVIVDLDGNFLAKFKLSPKEEKSIKVIGFAEVASRPFRNIYPKLTDAQKKNYIQPQRYWEIDNAFIREKAAELKTPQKIYEFVASFLTYNQDRLNDARIERKGAAQASISPEDAVCMEFTDLFIALSRGAGIPAREVEGFAYTQNERLRPLSLRSYAGDLLHAWPEYWDDNLGWVQVDPTWGATSGGLDYFEKLDFNHITFVQRGLSSTYPPPAGAYKKLDGQDAKSVFVSFSQEQSQAYAQPELTLSVADKIISGIPLKVTAHVANTGSASILQGELILQAADFQNNSPDPKNLGILPPHSQRSITYNLQLPGFFQQGNKTLTLTFADTSVTKTVSVIPIYFLFISPSFALALTLVLAIIIFGLLLYKRSFSTNKQSFSSNKRSLRSSSLDKLGTAGLKQSFSTNKQSFSTNKRPFNKKLKIPPYD